MVGEIDLEHACQLTLITTTRTSADEARTVAQKFDWTAGHLDVVAPFIHHANDEFRQRASESHFGDLHLLSLLTTARTWPTSTATPRPLALLLTLTIRRSVGRSVGRDFDLADHGTGYILRWLDIPTDRAVAYCSGADVDQRFVKD